MKGTSKTIVIVSVVAILLAVTSIIFFFKPSPTTTTGGTPSTYTPPSLGQGSSFGIGLYDINGNLIGTLRDTAPSFALYTVNTLNDVYSVTFGGSVCVLSPYEMVIDVSTNSPAIKTAINQAINQYKTGTTNDGKSVVHLEPNDCLQFSTGKIILDQAGAGKFNISFRANGYTNFENGVVSGLIETADSNVIHMDVVLQPSVQVSVSMTPSSEAGEVITPTTTTTGTGGVKPPEETVVGCTATVKMYGLTSVSAGGYPTCGTKATLFWCDLTKYSKCYLDCGAGSWTVTIDSTHYTHGCKSAGFTIGKDCVFTKTLITC